MTKNQPLSHQLANIKSQVRARPTNWTKDARINFPPLHMLKGDGVDHINVHLKGITNLGRALSDHYTSPFVHPVYGPFSTVTGFWQWLTSTDRDDNFRSLSGYDATKYGRNKQQVQNVPNFRYDILIAHWQKISGNDHLANAVKESTLPFDAYYIHQSQGQQTGYPIRIRHFHWMLIGLEIIREALKNNTQPDFSRFIDNNDTLNNVEIPIVKQNNQVRQEQLQKEKEKKQATPPQPKKKKGPKQPMISTNPDTTPPEVNQGRGQTTSVFHVDEAGHLNVHESVKPVINESGENDCFPEQLAVPVDQPKDPIIGDETAISDNPVSDVSNLVWQDQTTNQAAV